MAVARHGEGVVPAARALASQVHPVFMLPPLAVSLFGGFLAGGSAVLPGLAHVAAIFFAVYTAHVKDGYVDFHRRGEDDDHPLTVGGCRLGLAAGAAGFLVALAALWLWAGPWTAVVTAPTWAIGYLHAPQLDLHPVGATAGYPTGIALALLGGYYAQAGQLAPEPLAYAGVFLVLLSGVKVVDDAQDYRYDRSISKRTVAVVLGLDSAARLAYGLMLAALLAVGLLALTPVFPTGAALASLAFLAVVAYARRAGPELATMLLVRGSYVFLAVLLAAVWFRPLG